MCIFEMLILCLYAIPFPNAITENKMVFLIQILRSGTLY